MTRAGWQSSWEGLVAEASPAPARRLLRAGLSAAAVPFGLFLAAKGGTYRLGLRRACRLPVPVLVVGNLTLGGTGKTTATQHLVRRLAGRGARAGVISRGYGGHAHNGPVVVSDGTRVLSTVHECGDEALLLARSLPGHPVAAARRREAAGRAVLATLKDPTGAPTGEPVRAFVVDDGFQYLRLHRDADILLVDASRPFLADHLFPAGRLREPRRNATRASQIWITHCEVAADAAVQQLAAWASATLGGQPPVLTAHAPAGARLLAGPPLDGDLRGERVLALSALGAPASFEACLAQDGCEVRPLRYPDHHCYAPPDWERIGAAQRDCRAAWIATTEKDAVKLTPPPPDVGPVAVLGCELQIVEGEQQVERLLDEALSCAASEPKGR